MGLADRLRARKVPTEVVRLPIDPAQYAQAERELEAATWTLEEARARGSADLADLQARVDSARVALATCECEELTLRALPPAEWEELLGLHPPTEEQRAAGAQWNVTTLRAPLLALSVVAAEGDETLSEADWEQLAKASALASGELTALFNAAISLNVRAPSSAVGKG